MQMLNAYPSIHFAHKIRKTLGASGGKIILIPRGVPIFTLRTLLNRILWLLPFVSFFLGYQLLALLYGAESVATPAVIGKNIQDTLTVLTAHNLNTRLLATKEVPELPAGTVLSQSPQPQAKIKPGQTVYIVVSTKQQLLTAPNLINSTLNSITPRLKAAGIRNKLYYMQSNLPQDYCVGQFPNPGQLLKEAKIITYISSGTSKPVLLPNFKGKPVMEVQEFLSHHGITVRTSHVVPQEQGHVCTECMVTDQRPLPGSLITLDSQKQPIIHLQIG
jgi:hypothetical protein